MLLGNGSFIARGCVLHVRCYFSELTKRGRGQRAFLKLADPSRFHWIPAHTPDSINQFYCFFSIESGQSPRLQVRSPRSSPGCGTICFLRFWAAHLTFHILCLPFQKLERGDYSLFQSLLGRIKIFLNSIFPRSNALQLIKPNCILSN